MTLFVGTSGWAYPEWKPGFYPQDVPRSRFLEHYGSRLSSCEVNASFYKAQDRDVLKRWTDAVPAPFRFAVKVHRALTHGKAIAIDDFRRQRLTEFLETAGVFGDRLGPVLFQLPAYRKLELDGLRSVLEALPQDLRFAFEFRDASWDIPQVTEAIVAAGGTICLADTTGEVPESLPPGEFAYVRMRAPRYPSRKRAGWRKLLQTEGAVRDVYAFTKHEGIPAGDPFGGIGLAVWLERYARRQPTPTPAPESESSNHTDVA